MTKHIPVRGVRTLARDRRGATIIEFALVAAPFIALILATIQTSLVFFAQQCLETVAEETARDLVTGAAQKQGLTQEEFASTACKNLMRTAAFLKCTNLMVDVQTADSFADIDLAPPTVSYNDNGTPKNNWQYHPGDAGSIVVMRTMYLLPVVGGPLGFNLATAGNGKRLLIATSVFKSEPFKS
ncbi:pilus assembly protein [Sphingomonas koreensis]|nr:pilus assembly protein [Sphingomonas koreensis]